jgi:hypothetical protein
VADFSGHPAIGSEVNRDARRYRKSHARGRRENDQCLLHDTTLALTYTTAADRNREALDPSRFQGLLLKKADDRQPLTSPRISGGAMSRADTVGVGFV